MESRSRPESQVFAEEMARACLNLVPGYDGEIWQHATVVIGGGDHRSVILTIRVRNRDDEFQIYGSISRVNGEWAGGDCTVLLGDDASTTRSFTCVLRDSQFIATQTDPITPDPSTDMES